MALVITNGEYYVVPNKKGGINKTNDITEAQVFLMLIPQRKS